MNANISDVNKMETGDEHLSQEFKLELDSHANMPVVGKGAQVEYTGRTADANAFSPTYDTAQLPIVDAVLQYDCPHSGKTYLLIIRNALYVPEMTNHLIPPFAMREAGIIVHDVPKIHVDDPSLSDHSLEFPETKFRIPLSLHGMFSYLPTSKPTTQMLEDCEEVYVLTPSRWDPHSSAYAQNEAQMIDWQGDLVEPKDRQTIDLNGIEEDADISAACYIGHVESQQVIGLLQSQEGDDNIDDQCYHNLVPRSTDEIASVLTSVNPLLTDASLYERLHSKNRTSQFKMSIGSTTASEIKHVIHDGIIMDEDTDLDN